MMELSSPFLYKSIKIDIMNVIKTDIEGMLIIEPRLFKDARGYFFESFSKREFKEKYSHWWATRWSFARTMRA